MVRIKAHVRNVSAIKKLNTIYKSIERAGEASANHIKDLGKYWAKYLAPKDSGKTSDLIIGQVIPTFEGYNIKIEARNPTANDNHLRYQASEPYNYKGKFHLVKYMDTSPNAEEHFNNGDIHFMKSTRRLLKNQGINVARTEFNKIRI